VKDLVCSDARLEYFSRIPMQYKREFAEAANSRVSQTCGGNVVS